MEFVFTLINRHPYIDLPFHIEGWIWLFTLLGMLAWGVARTWESPSRRNGWQWWFFYILFGFTFVTTLFIGVRLTGGSTQPVPGLPMEQLPPVVMIFLAIPWVLAAGILTPAAAAILGLLSGILTAFFESHSAFTILEMGGLAFLFSIAVRQKYRTFVFDILRHPFGAAVVLSILFTPFHFLSIHFSLDASYVTRLDFAFNQVLIILLVRSLELIIAGMVAELVYLFPGNIWERSRKLLPSPQESSLQSRFLFGTIPVFLGLFIMVMASGWTIAADAATRQISNRLEGIADVAADTIPYYLETGQGILLSLATPDMFLLPQETLHSTLEDDLHSLPYFSQFFAFNAEGQPITGYPVSNVNELNLSDREYSGIALALKGVPVQVYPAVPATGATSAQTAFIAAVLDDQGQVQGVLFAKTDLHSNPFTQPLIKAFDELVAIGGHGVILDEDKTILYYPVPSLVMTKYSGDVPEMEGFYENISPEGIRQLVYYKPIMAASWSILLDVPTEQANQVALQFAVPLLVILVILSALAYLLLRSGLKPISSSLASLAKEATLIAEGNLEHELPAGGVDEVGELGTAFETMRKSLKARLDELNRLLKVSQAVASKLSAGEAIQPVLEAALIHGANSARIVMTGEVTGEATADRLIVFGTGTASESYSSLDGQIYELMEGEDIISLPNCQRSHRFRISLPAEMPGAILAVSIHHDEHYFGALWIAFETPTLFTQEDVRFLSTLAGQAALAAANSAWFTSAEMGRRRLEAVLASTPEPVMVLDNQLKLILLNPAALQVPNLLRTSLPGRVIDEVVQHPGLIEFIKSDLKERSASREIVFPNGRIYFASVSPVYSEDTDFGRVCLLRDITHYKQLDNLKSEYVTHVSHDLRSPLTFIRGYTSMLNMVGDLNAQQKTFVEKIITDVDNISHLVENLLDLGRIEAGIGLEMESETPEKVIDRVINILKPQAVQKRIRLEQEIDPDSSASSCVVEADWALLQQAMLNLVGNAIRYTPVGGRVAIRLQCQPDSVVFEVKDNGVGISPIDLPHVFEKFHKSGTKQSPESHGTGLGLAIVKSITERHGGRVWVESMLGKGSSFFIRIPKRIQRIDLTEAGNPLE